VRATVTVAFDPIKWPLVLVILLRSGRKQSMKICIVSAIVKLFFIFYFQFLWPAAAARSIEFAAYVKLNNSVYNS
jgi:hypothetical protein